MKTITDVWLLSVNSPKDSMSLDAQFHVTARLETKLWCTRGARLIRMGVGCHCHLCLHKIHHQGHRVTSYTAGTSSRTPFFFWFSDELQWEVAVEATLTELYLLHHLEEKPVALLRVTRVVGHTGAAF